MVSYDKKNQKKEKNIKCLWVTSRVAWLPPLSYVFTVGLPANLLGTSPQAHQLAMSLTANLYTILLTSLILILPRIFVRQDTLVDHFQNSHEQYIDSLLGRQGKIKIMLLINIKAKGMQKL